MADQWRYRGRTIGAEDVTFIRQLIAQHPRLSRRKLSVKLCEAWQWRQANGALRDMVCRGLLLMLHRAGAIELPKVRQVSPNPLARREPPPAMHVDQTPITDPFQQIMPIEIEQVRRTAHEPLFNSLMEHHHYLGYEQPVGEHVKYLAWSQPPQRRGPVAGDPGERRPIACLAWSSAPRHLGSRDRYIGWNAQARRANIRLITYNTRFLILPWVRVPHLASHLLARVTARLTRDWEQMYSHPVYFAETFIDPGRFRGTCYRAANWKLMGVTTGRGKDDHTNRPNRPIKEVFGYPLDPRFRQLLSQL